MKISAGQARDRMLYVRKSRIFAYDLRFNWLMFKICRAANKGKSQLIVFGISQTLAEYFKEDLQDLDYTVRIEKAGNALRIKWD